MVFKKSYIWIVVGLVLTGVLIFLTHPLWCSHDYEVVRETGASCTHPGEVLSECRLCGKDKTETIEALGHSMRYETTEMEEVGESIY